MSIGVNSSEGSALTGQKVGADDKPLTPGLFRLSDFSADSRPRLRDRGLEPPMSIGANSSEGSALTGEKVGADDKPLTPGLFRLSDFSADSRPRLRDRGLEPPMSIGANSSKGSGLTGEKVGADDKALTPGLFRLSDFNADSRPRLRDRGL